MRTAQNLRWLSAAAVASILAIQAHAAQKVKNSLEDSDITRAVEEELLFDQAVPYNDIDVHTLTGIVSLTGETKNLLAKERATLLAETVRGVRAVSNRIEVKPTKTVSSQDLKKSVEEAFLFDPVAESYEINVEAKKDGSIRLTGEVDSWQESKLAERVAMGVIGVTEVDNALTVSYAVNRPDHEMKSEIEKLLAWSTLIDDVLVEVAVHDQVAKLTGTVGSLAEKRQAENIAWVGGINSVDTSDLRVERWARDDDLRKDKFAAKSDEAIRQAINDAMLYDPRVVGLAVNPEVESSWVTLYGKVDNILAKESAEAIARHTVGVTGVTNMLKIRTEASVEEEALADIIEAKLVRDPMIRSEAINVEVDENTVRLNGVVDNLFEKARCETIAQSTVGVTEIKNYLQVMEKESVIVYDPYLWGYTLTPWGFYDKYRPVTTEVFASSNDDRRTAKRIAEEIYWSPFISLEDISIAVDDGIATLVGEVESLKEKNAATENAIEGGALSVVNKIVVDS
ncbi:BON domain-containing protein [Pelagicoccus enzymogenes]|uniref:BON domain-containing protein n=1 Tax=Pelagicoccus enzymogenes TaxID=2773457 RepID=UPI00280D931A|nr:BON domain-containing protein [Pelagicoccus enzymogenes]MDQ8198831.1 BON domain-containing protein [Pelagicoccus enzymogenes]